MHPHTHKKHVLFVCVLPGLRGVWSLALECRSDIAARQVLPAELLACVMAADRALGEFAPNWRRLEQLLDANSKGELAYNGTGFFVSVQRGLLKLLAVPSLE